MPRAASAREESVRPSDLATEAPAFFVSAPRARFGRTRKEVVRTLLWAIEPFLELRESHSIPLPYATTFLMVALDEGKGVNALAREAGKHRSTMSRYLRDIGARARNGGPGLGLVSVEEHPDDPLRTQVFLTPKGRTLAKEVFRRLRKLKHPAN
jgi:DNA-binding MarR family transcriptional regulator